jgi:hypothetical protein
MNISHQDRHGTNLQCHQIVINLDNPNRSTNTKHGGKMADLKHAKPMVRVSDKHELEKYQEMLRKLQCKGQLQHMQFGQNRRTSFRVKNKAKLIERLAT